MKKIATILNLFLLHTLSVIGFAQGLVIPQGGVVTANNAYIVLAKNWVNNGSFVQHGGAVIFAGGANQTISGRSSTTFDYMGVAANSNTTITAGPQYLKSILLCNGTLNANDQLTLLSTNQQTALIDGAGTGQVLGRVTMQRYLASGFGYKYFGTAFQDATVNEFAGEVDLSASFPRFYRYDENQVSTGWLTYVDPTGALLPGEGYAANLGASAAPTTIDVSGVVNNGTIVTNLYNHNRAYTKGFNLVGNPYPSPIDWHATTGWLRDNVDNALYFFNASGTDQYTGTYSSYINGISSDGIASNIIPSMQGFFVHVSDGVYPVSATFSMDNTVRTRDLNPGFQGGGNSAPMVRISVAYDNGPVKADPAVFYINNNASEKFDKRLDALKMMNTSKDVPNLFAVAEDTSRISIRAFAYPRDTSTVLPLGLQTAKDGYVNFNTVQVQQMPATLNIYLYDDKAKVYHDLRNDKAYRLYLAAGEYKGRFSIVFSKKSLAADNVDNTYLKAFYGQGKLFVNTNIPADEHSALELVNVIGQRIWQSPFTGSGSYAINARLVKGVYVVKLVSGKQLKTQKIFISD